MKSPGMEKNALDHFLVAVGSVSASYAVGMSVNKPNLALMLASLIAFASVIGFFLSKATEKLVIRKYDAWLWSGLGLTCWVMIRPMNQLLIDGGFPIQLFAASALCWMLMLCTVVSWRDQTLLFLSLPSIAIFGLVGTFDTYPPATFLFFAFLMCIGVLYARMHQRAMLQRARLAGEENPELLFRGAWKWVAGPEVAFASGFVVIFLSLIGAPMLRFSVQSVAGAVKIQFTPQQTPPAPTNPATTGPQSEVRIGRGPNNPSNIEVFRVKTDEPGLMRHQSYSKYTSSGWSRQASNVSEESPLRARVSTTDPSIMIGEHGGVQGFKNGIPPAFPITNPRYILISLIATGIVPPKVPAPGPVTEFLGQQVNGVFYANGDFVLANSPQRGSEYSFYTAVPATQVPPTAKAKALDETAPIYLETEYVSLRVKLLAQQLTLNLKSDIEKADAIRQYVSRRIKYNLNAQAVPFTRDPVDYTLFESRQGYCDLFASSVVTLARSVGLPARYTIGWVVNDPKTDEKGYYIVREKDYHAWAEIYFEGYGWVPFDATEGADEIDGSGRGSSNVKDLPFYLQPLFFCIIGSVAAAAILIPLLISGFRALKDWRSRENRINSEMVRLYNSFHLAIEAQTRAPKRFSQTLREYVDSSSEVLADLHPLAAKISTGFEGLFFAKEGATKENIKTVSAMVSEFKSQLKARKK